MEDKLRETFLYFLIDPRTYEIRYVGKTVQKLQYRLRQHLTEKSNNKRKNWIKSLQNLGLQPIIQEVFSCTWQISAQAEIRLIAICRKYGIRLTNLTDGGDGTIGRKLTEEDKRKLSLSLRSNPKVLAGVRKGIKHTKEAIEKIKNNRKDWSRSKESIEKQRRTITGRKRPNMSSINMIESTRKEVLKISLDGKILEKYPSMNQAGRENNIHGSKISLCCPGKRKYAGGYIWRLAN